MRSSCTRGTSPAAPVSPTSRIRSRWKRAWPRWPACTRPTTSTPARASSSRRCRCPTMPRSLIGSWHTAGAIPAGPAGSAAGRASRHAGGRYKIPLPATPARERPPERTPERGRGHTVVVSYDPTIYQGAAAHYRYGRPAYSPQLEAVLSQELDLDGSGRLLDGGCGPGILTVRLAHLFEEAVGLDPDPAMLAEGRRAADERGLTNIRWVQALAEDLPGAAPGPYRLVTFGQSFHWTDEARVAEAVYDMLAPGGALALIVHTVQGRPAPPSPGPPPIPHQRSRCWWRSISDQPGAPARASRRFEPTTSKTSL